MKNLNFLVFSLVSIFVFNACAGSQKLTEDEILYRVNENKVFPNLNSSINAISNQLFLNNIKVFKKNSDRIVITTFINNENLKSTSTLGRVISESLINDLHIKDFRIIDLTTKEDISINQNGMFYLSRNLNELKSKQSNIFIVTGTYSKFDYDSIVLNARLIDFDSSDVLSTARVVYSHKDCSLVDLCEDEKIKVLKD